MEVHKMNRYYIAYGSNLNFYQMERRCPDSQFIGTGILKNCKLVFRGDKYNAVATVEPKNDSIVQVGVWKISQADEKSLDIYEGFPKLYRKENVKINLGDIEANAMLYLMNDGYDYGMPSRIYLNTIRQGYQDCHLDEKQLMESVDHMKKMIEKSEMEERFPLGYKDIRS